jgi:hypothetical protein
MKNLSYVVMPFNFVDFYHRFGGIYGGDTLLRNVGNNLQDLTASQPRRPQSTFSLPRNLSGIKTNYLYLLEAEAHLNNI